MPIYANAVPFFLNQIRICKKKSHSKFNEHKNTQTGLDFAGSYVLLKAFQQLCAPSGMKVTSGWQPSLMLV